MQNSAGTGNFRNAVLKRNDFAANEIGVSEEASDKLIHRPTVKLPGSAELNNIAFVKNRNAVRHAQRLAPVMRHIKRRHSALLADAADLQTHGIAQAGVKVRKRFIEKKDRRVHRKRACKRNPLLLSARKRLNPAVRTIGETHKLKHFANLFANRGFLFPLNLKSERDILKNAHVRPKRVVLKNHRGAPLLGRKIRHVGSVKQNPTSIRLQKTGYDAEKR